MLGERLLDWMEKAPAPARAQAVPSLVRTLVQGRLDDAARDFLDTVLTMLLDDPSVEVRRSFAEALAVEEYAPRHLVVALSLDVPVVAEALFRRSPCLIDSELIAAATTGGARIQRAIAIRPWLSMAVSDALADAGCRDAVLAMLRNEGADLDETSYRSIVARFGTDGDMREAMFARTDLPIAVRQSLIASLGAKLGMLMVSREWVPGTRADQLVRDACDKATVRLAAEASEAELAPLIEHLRASGQLTTALLIRSMCLGHIRFLEAALARLSGLPATRVYALLVEGREAGLRALFTRAGLPVRSHAAFLVALEVWRELDYDGGSGDRSRFARRMVERILTRYQAMEAAEVDDLLAMLRRLAADTARDAARAYGASRARDRHAA